MMTAVILQYTICYKSKSCVYTGFKWMLDCLATSCSFLVKSNHFSSTSHHLGSNFRCTLFILYFLRRHPPCHINQYHCKPEWIPSLSTITTSASIPPILTGIESDFNEAQLSNRDCDPPSSHS